MSVRYIAFALYLKQHFPLSLPIQRNVFIEPRSKIFDGCKLPAQDGLLDIGCEKSKCQSPSGPRIRRRLHVCVVARSKWGRVNGAQLRVRSTEQRQESRIGFDIWADHAIDSGASAPSL